MTVAELAVRSSVQIYQADKEVLKPQGFGTGCIVRYLNRTFLLSVSHVTNNDNLTTFLETNQPPVDNTTPLKPIGGLIYYDVIKLSENDNLEDFDNIIETKGERIDITFAELKEHVELKQPALDFGFLKIEESDKLMLNLDYAVEPNKEENYSFYGKINPRYNGIYLEMTPTLKLGLKFHRSKGYFHKFLASEIITNKDDYRGCSGAPIIDSEGRLVALACKIMMNSKNCVWGFNTRMHETNEAGD